MTRYEFAAALNAVLNRIGDRGLFGDTYQGIIEVEYLPSQNFALRLQCSGGEIFNNRADVFGVNAELALSPRFAIFSRTEYLIC